MANTYNKTCVICGKEFEAKAPNAKYCSDVCRKKAASNRAKQKKEKERAEKQLNTKEQTDIKIEDDFEEEQIKEILKEEQKKENQDLKEDETKEKYVIKEIDIQDKKATEALEEKIKKEAFKNIDTQEDELFFGQQLHNLENSLNAYYNKKKENDEVETKMVNILDVDVKSGEIAGEKAVIVSKEHLSGFRRARNNEFEYIRKRVARTAKERIKSGTTLTICVAIAIALMIILTVLNPGLRAVPVTSMIVLLIIICGLIFYLRDGIKLRNMPRENIFYVMECNVYCTTSGMFDSRLGVLIKNDKNEYCKDVFLINPKTAKEARKNPEKKFLLVRYYYDGKIGRELIPVRKKKISAVQSTTPT